MLLILLSINTSDNYIELPFDKGDTVEIYFNDKYDKTLIDNSLNIIPLSVLRFYQIIISPAQGEVCNFTPSCSNYMFKAIRKYGFALGFIKGIDRLQRCNLNARDYLHVHYSDYVLTKERGYKIIDNP
ncbi:TPA: hypothetical protein DCW38_03675 [candidate division WOR-3 bacterium]|jgi:hypothetical protein|uniref:Membrane protein insertion efficiency factor YidD n=1 Tax=candidate division WOR-3 bacterium TaxID=2052148 RepID=A0A350H9P5_UNCW3|nr:hypothetical protein [candidate division WOR-3 bacterium]